MNPYKRNTNEEMRSDQKKATVALNELLSFAMSGRLPASQKDEVWTYVDVIKDFIDSN